MMFKAVLNAVAVFQFIALSAAALCDPRCTAGGTCQNDGRCLCWWGWTGPKATYITSGLYNKRILADYCTTACHYTHDYRNPACASTPTPQVYKCRVPMNTIVPPLPCDPWCGTGSFYGRGSCLSSGRCLCWWGWTGPNACYVDGGTYNNRIIADMCYQPCHYTNLYRNVRCTQNKAAISTPSSTTQPSTAAKPTTTVSCDPRCQGGQGTCRPSDGRCFCWWGWTGPNATYIISGQDKNRILADYCTTACHYTHDYLNPDCASIPNPKECAVPVNKTVPPLRCDPLCGTGIYYGRGKCLSNGHCLCWWGWTGPNACYVDGGTYNNRIIADRCIDPCHYTHDHRNYNCTKAMPTTKPSTPPSSTGNPITGQPTTTTTTRTTGKPTTTAVSCNPRCQGGQGTCCPSDGRCFCWWGWTGPNATYIISGQDKNRILADYCTTACHYTHDYLNPDCASIPNPKECAVPVNKTVPPLHCDPLCGTGSFYGRGSCLSSGRCLCWWGWTGPNACYVDGGTYNNRIVADRCIDPCHYTHDYRNYDCTKAKPTTKPSTLPSSTRIPTTGQPKTTGKPTTGKPRTTGKPTTEKSTTGQPTTTGKPTTGKPTTGKPTTGQPTTAYPTTGRPRTRQPTTGYPTTKNPTTTAKPTSGKPTTAISYQSSTKQQTTTNSPKTTTTSPQQTTTNIPDTTTMPPSTKQETTTGEVSSTTAKATTMQPVTTGAKTSAPTTVAPTTKEKTTTQRVISTTAKATTTQATTTTESTEPTEPTEPPEPTEPTEPPEPTEPTEPGVLQVRGMPHQNQLQNDIDVSEVKDDEAKEDKEEKKFSPTGLVIVMVVLLICVLALVGAVWWTYGNGNQFPSLLRGYEPVRDSDTNMMMSELSETMPLP